MKNTCILRGQLTILLQDYTNDVALINKMAELLSMTSEQFKAECEATDRSQTSILSEDYGASIEAVCLFIKLFAMTDDEFEKVSSDALDKFISEVTQLGQIANM